MNNRYYQDENMREQRLAGIDSQISDQEKLDEINRKQYDVAARVEDRAAQARSRDELNGIRQQSAEERTRHDQEIEDLRRQLGEANSLSGKADARAELVKRLGMKLTPQEYRSCVLVGKLPDDGFKAKQLQIPKAG